MSSHPGPPPPACTCLPTWPALTTIIDGILHPVVPTPSHTPTSALYLARCTGCDAPYTDPWKRLNTTSHAA